ncbi:DUF3592 domain-containing protein [Roseibacillus persicicus]|uniref:DUF3592 domain-containing protein n=1 Tax=Roseibacillus persicicus TaxID=454148 RepID=UPI00398B834F
MKQGSAGSFYLIGIGLMLALSGAVFTWLLGASFGRAREMDHWKESPCLILESEMRERKIGPEVPTDYSFGLLYGYEFDDEPYSSEHFDLRGNAWVKDATRIQALINNYPAGTQQTCWVNPDNPEQAVLKKETKAPGYSIWFPILFFVGGLGIVVKAIWNLVRAKATANKGEQPG